MRRAHPERNEVKLKDARRSAQDACDDDIAGFGIRPIALPRRYLFTRGKKVWNPSTVKSSTLDVLPR